MTIHLNQARILVADDEDDLRTLLCEAIRGFHASVEAVSNGKDAYELLSQRPFDYDVLLTDIDMPVMNGFELIAKLRQNQIPVTPVVISGHDTIENYRMGMRYSIFDFLPKPFKADDIALVLTRAYKDSCMAKFHKLLLTYTCEELNQPELLNVILAAPINKQIESWKILVDLVRLRHEKNHHRMMREHESKTK